jgi:hypothetical protein
MVIMEFNSGTIYGNTTEKMPPPNRSRQFMSQKLQMWKEMMLVLMWLTIAAIICMAAVWILVSDDE